MLKPMEGFILLTTTKEANPKGYIFEDTDKTPRIGKVLDVGGNTYHENGEVFNCPVKVGDIIIHSGYGYENITYEGEEYRIVPFSKILAVVKENK